MRATLLQMTEIQIHDDFGLDRIAESGQCFRWVKESPQTYRIVHGAHCLLIHALGNGRFNLSCTENEYRTIWYDYFDFGEDYQSVRSRICEKEDPFLFRACEYGKGIRILRQDPWETLISFIISQNKNIPAIRKSIELLCAEVGNIQTDEEGRKFFVFPSPEEILALPDETLAACRLGYRCRYVKAAAAEVADGKLDLKKLQGEAEDTVLKALTAVLGIGVKVANCVSLFGLHHIDAFPVDVWIRRILDREYPAGYPIEKYRPYNGIYQQYMFYYYRERYGAERGT